uniref:Uncharacterized protein n=1 Tax=Physcomitrium patens TaxID=3218 RepID=A0A2K1KV33_PHYPA|nr:hypothetical protein PHYPA_004615 [Physcomitrium patens]
MSHRDEALIGDDFKRTSMNLDFYPLRNGKCWRKIWNSKGIYRPSLTLPLRDSATSRARVRAFSSYTSRYSESMSVFNVAKVWRDLEKQAMLATGVYTTSSVPGNGRKDEIVTLRHLNVIHTEEPASASVRNEVCRRVRRQLVYLICGVLSELGQAPTSQS